MLPTVWSWGPWQHYPSLARPGLEPSLVTGARQAASKQPAKGRCPHPDQVRGAKRKGGSVEAAQVGNC